MQKSFIYIHPHPYFICSDILSKMGGAYNPNSYILFIIQCTGTLADTVVGW